MCVTPDSKKRKTINGLMLNICLKKLYWSIISEELSDDYQIKKNNNELM